MSQNMNTRRYIWAALAAVMAVMTAMPAYAVEELQLPVVPSELVKPADRADYILMHFWDNMEFADTVRSRDRGFMEQNFVNYLSVFPHARPATVTPAVDALMDAASVDRGCLSLLADLADMYLFGSDSPMRSEEFYRPFVEYVASTPVLPDSEKERARWLAGELRKCRPGTVAPDFAFVDPEGRCLSLHAVETGGCEVTLLFYDPECDTCHEVIRDMASEGAAGRVVVAVCVSGDQEAWRADLVNLPKEWIVGYPEEPVEDLYSIWGMPTIYRLTSDGRILSKER